MMTYTLTCLIDLSLNIPVFLSQNLDNWKSSRRKRVEPIIERCVELRKMEQEPNQPRAKSKTFNEMLEER